MILRIKKNCIVVGIWTAIISFITPIWLTLMFLNITGEIYKLDDSMDVGSAGFIGVILLITWLLLALLPCAFFMNKLYCRRKKYVVIGLVLIIVLMVLCIAMCNWDIVEFLTTPNGA